jgi:hypothetical protein
VDVASRDDWRPEELLQEASSVSSIRRVGELQQADSPVVAGDQRAEWTS